MTSLVNKSHHITQFLAHAVMQGDAYRNHWSPVYRLDKIEEAVVTLKEEPTVLITAEDISSATEMDFRVAGFSAWDEPDINNQVLMLVPLWIHPFIEQSLFTNSISYLDGTEPKTLAEIDLDHRDGYTAYGFLVDVAEVFESSGDIEL